MFTDITGSSCQWANTLVITDGCQWEFVNTGSEVKDGENEGSDELEG
ncbi:hypothetical protein SLEP1_g24444 [Rubroshorea leprosula]|uniref:Uncharacterized protein n=1 Tax=Rubroshorea leprosula TaxID=152421 RepID=A0AAV5JQ06_9ROSI|nr:hypothetical protein SLEP1_g24444 [Rubroshorea leprosula]